MISAVVPLRPIPQPQLPPTVSPVVRNPVKDRAAAGYFRDLALWLNEPLVNQGIFVQVQADDRPGCLKLTVEFERSPIQDRLTRFLCHRIWQLNSELIEGIYILARPVGWQRVLWKQRIKISTPALRRRKAQEQLRQAARMTRSPLPYAQRARRRRRRRTPFALLTGQRFKTLRALMLTGSAAAAFILGCLLEVTLSGPSPSLPTFSAQATPAETRPGADDLRLTPEASAAPGLALGSQAETESLEPAGRSTSATATPASAPRPPRPSSGSRPSVVDTALEPVAVISYAKPSPVPPDQVTLAFGGDISLEDLDFAQLEKEGGFFADVEDYFQADVSLVNLATPLATAATTLNEEFRQQLRPEAAQLLADSGVDIVNLTHSSLMQYGTEGLTETLTALDSSGLYRVGAGRNAVEARRPEILDVKGKRIAYLSYAMGGNDAAMDTSALRERAGAEDDAVARELENFKQSTAFRERAGFNAQNMPEIVQDIQAIRDQVDWIVVNFRWVDHLEETPNFVQTNLARLAIDQGADLVVGYHPTVVQGGEIYKGRPIAYSLGDFVFKPDQPLQDQDSAMLKVSLHEDQMQVEFVPVRIRDSRPHTLSGEAGRTVLDRIQSASSQFETPLQPSVVLDLQAPAMPAPESLDPSSPFVTPEAEDTLMLEGTPPASEETAPDAKADTPSDPVPEAIPAGEADDTLTLPTPEGVPDLDLQQIHQDLQEWGPKVSPQDEEFKPVPQNRSGAEETTLEAQAHPDLLGSFVDSPASLNAEAVEAWNDTVPATPTAPLEADPKADDPSPAPSPSGSLQSAPAVAPSLAEPEPSFPAAAETAAKADKATVDEEEAIPEAAFPATTVIPPEAEPLVGPLTLQNDGSDSVLGDSSVAVAILPEMP
ncbi:MAG: CapA family protein [Leptolyngbya sp.]|nr:CapA family protein [Leptolyngbya sp.]